MNTFAVQLIENPAGVAFSADMHRFTVAAAGRRSGKTLRAKCKAINRALFGPWSHPFVPRYAFCAPTRPQAKAIFWEDLKDTTARIRIEPPRETDLIIKMPHGPELHVVGLDEPARIEGSPWDGFVLDEVDDLKPGFWEEHLRPCLSDRLGWAILIGVPNGYGQLYDFSMLPQTDKEWSFHSWHSSEVLPAEEIASAMRTMDARTFRQEYQASFETATGRVYYAFDRARDVGDVPQSVMNGAVMVGMDFNVNPMSAVVFAEDGNHTYVIETIEIPSSNTQEMCDEIRRRYGMRCIDAYPDPAGRARKTSSEAGITDHIILRNNGFSVHTKLTVSVRDGINAVNSRFCTADGQRHVIVNRQCKRAVEIFERHEYKPGTSQPAADEWSHLCDAFRYAMDYRHSLIKRASWTQ